MNKKVSKEKGNVDKVTSSANAGDIPASGNIGQIRDILFGAQMRDYEKRFAQSEERMNKKATDLKNEMLKRMDTIESFIKQEVTSLNDQLKAEQNSRHKVTQKLSDEQKKAALVFEKTTTQMEKQITEKTRELRQQLLEQSKNLSEEISKKYQNASESLEKASRELNTEKVDRNALSDLFAEISMRLGDNQNIKALLESIPIEK